MIWSDFTKKNFECNNKFDIINDQFIKNLYKIKNDILKKKINFNYTIEETKISNKKINKLKNSEWVDPDLDVDYLNYDIHIKFDNNDIFIKTTKEKFFKIKKRLYIFLKIIKYINNNNKFTLYLILTNKKKYIDNSIISPKNINSGYTNINTNEIFIWREEEFEKVTFHEIIHLSNKDHRNENIDIPILINGPTSFYEAITDFKAIIFNLIYISIIKKNIKLDLLLKYELFFIYNQAKFINFYLNKNKKKKIIQQNTPAYSYFVLKYLIFDYFIKENFNNKLFNEIIYCNINLNKLIQFIKIYQLNENNFINFNSARMTLFELE